MFPGIDLLLPRACPLGHGPLPEHASSFCPICREGLIPCEPPWCAACGAPLPGASHHVDTCVECLLEPPPFAARALYWYAGRGAALLKAFKFDAHWRTGAWLAERMALSAACFAPADAHVVPMPSLPWRRFQLPYSPAGILAREIARALRLPFAPCLRARWVLRAPQHTRRLNQRRRLKANAFKAAPPRAPLLLIDDVTTTGASLRAAAAALKAAGAGEIFALTAFRTPTPANRGQKIAASVLE